MLVVLMTFRFPALFLRDRDPLCISCVFLLASMAPTLHIRSAGARLPSEGSLSLPAVSESAAAKDTGILWSSSRMSAALMPSREPSLACSVPFALGRSWSTGLSQSVDGSTLREALIIAGVSGLGPGVCPSLSEPPPERSPSLPSLQASLGVVEPESQGEPSQGEALAGSSAAPSPQSGELRRFATGRGRPRQGQGPPSMLSQCAAVCRRRSTYPVSWCCRMRPLTSCAPISSSFETVQGFTFTLGIASGSSFGSGEGSLAISALSTGFCKPGLPDEAGKKELAALCAWFG
mmetsp:Transcript_9428/g.17181  ORF Transcript_9428/g.17181 Transcript_9428/m.17181 type:complete len:291 (-) Transcript_9428:35-907(-)